MTLGPSAPPGEVTGRVLLLREGGALIVDEGRRPLLFLDPERLAASGAMDRDLVLARPLRRARPAQIAGPVSGGDRVSAAGRPLPGVVVRVLARAHPTVVGTFNREFGSGRREWVLPDDRRLPPIEVRGGSLGAEPGEKVVVAVAGFPGPGRPEPFGPVVERLGAAGDPDAETAAIIRSLGLPDTFPPEALAEADRLPREVNEAECEGRLDLRSHTVFTIDDEDARDLDDAVSLAGPDRDGVVWRLGVHIADVSHYVPEGSALDREAARRGTSVYLADRVLPMFPPALSNGIASLHPGPDRLTISVLLDVDAYGRVVGYDIARSVIRSAARLTYEEAAALMSSGPGAERPGGAGVLPPAAPPAGSVAEVLRAMAPLAERLRRRRMQRGSLDFDLVEEKARLDGQGRPLAVVRRRRDAATRLIEEFMIAANEAVADYLLWSGVPFIRRVHEEPLREDLVALREMLAPLGYRVPTTRVPRPAELQAILEASRGRPEGPEVHKALLQALPQARYSASPGGHYALASANYTHFTSPIRRYPDLTVHRRVAALLEGRARPDEVDAGRLEALAEACSRAERSAERAEAESLELMKARLGLASLGAVEEGEVVGVFDFGAFVRLPNGVEGLVAAAEGGRDLRPGGRIRVQVVRADVARRRVDLQPV